MIFCGLCQIDHDLDNRIECSHCKTVFCKDCIADHECEALNEDPATPMPCAECGSDYYYTTMKTSAGWWKTWAHPRMPGNFKEGCTQEFMGPCRKPIHPNRLKAEGLVKEKA